MKKVLTLILFFVLLLNNNVFANNNYERIDIKVGKSVNSGDGFYLESKDNFNIYTSDFQLIHKTSCNKLNIKFENSQINIDGDKYNMVNFPTDGTFLIHSTSPIKVSNIKRNYRGAISFRVNNGKLDIINNVDIDNYLRGVLPKEMSASFPLESLKAQALCSRSFAINNFNKYIKKGYNLDDTTNSQVYRGSDVEEKSTDKAIFETKNEVVKYNGKIAQTIFGASSGGITASAEEVWGSNVDYLISREDNFSNYKWEYKLTDKDFKKLGIDNLIDIRIDCTNDSNRVKNIILCTENDEKIYTGNKFRSMIGNTVIKSTLFEIEKIGSDFILRGRGYGHGVGMSQYGAVEMAKKGKNYKEIIEFYFPGTNIEKIN